MFVPIYDIRIGNFSLNYIHKVVVESSWKLLTSTCELTMPRNLKFKGERLESVVKVGNPVSVSVYYKGSAPRVEFVGFVSKINPQIPLQVECEDLMWKFKQRPFTYSSPSKIKLAELINLMMPGVDIGNVADIGLGLVRFSTQPPTVILEKLQKDFGIYTYFVDGKLYSGLPYQNPSKEVVYNLDSASGNVIKNALEYRSKDDVKVQIRAISNKPDGKKIKVEVGDAGGDVRTMNFYDKSESDLTALAEREIERLKVDGYSGTLESLLEPACNHGDVAVLTDTMYPMRAGRYQIDGVTMEAGVSGSVRKVKLGGRVS